MRILALVKRIFQQMLRDKRTLALMMIAPLIILTLVHFLFTSNANDLKLGIIDGEEAFVEQLDKEMAVSEYSSGIDVAQTILDDELDGMLQMDEGSYKLTVMNEDPSTTKAFQFKVKQIITAEASKKQAMMMPSSQGQMPNSIPQTGIQAPTIETAYLYGDQDTNFFDVLSPILVGFFVFFFVFLISGIALLRERTTGTLDRLLATPIKRHQIVFGYLVGYGLFAIVQTIIVVFYSVKVLDIVLAGSIWNVVLINLLLALVALSLGILLSAFANSEFQMMQFIPVAIIPQIFFAGILPIDNMDHWLQTIAKFVPMYYGGDALVGVMYKGAGLSDIYFDLLILLAFAVLFIVLNIFALKKYRKI